MNPLPPLTLPPVVGQPVKYTALVIDPTIPRRPRCRRRSFDGVVTRVHEDKTTCDISYVVSLPDGPAWKMAREVPGVGDYLLGEFWLERP